MSVFTASGAKETPEYLCPRETVTVDGGSMISIEEQLSVEEGNAIMQRGLGKYELELVTSFCTPLYCALRDESGNVYSRNGTAFFLDAGAGLFAVTAAHVIEGLRKLRETEGARLPRLAGNGTSIQLDLDARVIDAHADIDIATFRILMKQR
jgi:hypothetical protein